MGFFPAIVEITDENGVRVDKPDVAENQAPIRLVLGNNIQGTATTNGGLTEVRLDAAGGEGVALADHDAFRALALVDLSNNEVFQFTSPPGTFVYDTTSGAGVADDDQNVLRNTNVLLGQNGRAYNVNTSAILPTIAALRLATWSSQNTIHVQNYATIGDHGGGIFDYDSNDVTTADDNGVVIVAGTRRYKRRYSGTIEAAWFGGIAKKYFNEADGKLYIDPTFNSISPLDYVNINRASAYANSIGGGNVHFVGDYYAEPTGTFKKVFTLYSNVSIFGDGYASYVLMKPGVNTAGAGGYSGFFGSGNFSELATGRFFNSADSKYYDDAGFTISASKDNVTLRNFVTDGNSDFNQFSPNRGAVANNQNNSVAILQGTNNVFQGVVSLNSAGVFQFSMGTYGYPEATTNIRIIDCHAIHAGDDPTVGDTSVFACGATKYVVSGCSVDATNNAAFPPSGQPAPISAFEMHGSNLNFFGNKAISTLRLLNIAGDSYRDVDHFNVYGNICERTILGITFFIYAGRSCKNTKIHNNIFTHIPGVFPTGEAGIDVASPFVIVSNPDGNGFENVEIYENQFTLVGTPTAGDNSVAIRLLENLKNVKICNNTLDGWGSLAITCNTTRQGTEAFTRSGSTLTSAGHTRFNDWEVRPYSTGTLPAPLVAGKPYYVVNSVTNVSMQLSLTRGGSPVTLTDAGTGVHYIQGNICEDVLIRGNRGKNPGVVGAQLFSGAVEITPSHRGITIDQNEWTDTVGVLQYGTYIYAPCDHSIKVGPNKVSGFSIAEHKFDTVTYPGIGNLDALHVFMASAWGVSVAASAAVNGAAIQKAVDWVSTHGGGILAFNAGLFLSTPINFKSGVYLRGAGRGFYGFNAGTTIQIAGTVAGFTGHEISYFGLTDLAVYMSEFPGVGASAVLLTATNGNVQHGRFDHCMFVMNGTAAAGIDTVVNGTGNIYYTQVDNCDMRGIATNVGNAGIRTRTTAPVAGRGGNLRMRVHGGNWTALERGFDLEFCVAAMVDSVSLDNMATGTSSGRYILLGAGSIANRFTNMGFEASPAADKAVEMINDAHSVADNFVSSYLEGCPAGWVTDNGVRNGWEGGDAAGAGGGVRDKHPFPTDFGVPQAFNAGLTLGTSAGPLVTSYAGSPEGNVTAVVGSLVADSTNGKLYQKHTGSGNTGWLLVPGTGTPTAGYQQLGWDGSDWFFLGIKSAALANADATIDITMGSQFVLPPATLGANHTVTLDATTGSPGINRGLSIVRRDVTNKTLAVVNGGPGAGTIYTFVASKAGQAVFNFDGTNWYFVTDVELN